MRKGREPAVGADARRRASSLASIRCAFPWLRQIFVDGDYASDKLVLAPTGEEA